MKASGPSRTAPETEHPVRVLIADDHPLVIEGLTVALNRYGIEVVAEGTAPGDVILRYEESSPDAVVLDVRFAEEMSGLDVARELLKRYPDARIVFYSQFNQDSILREVYRVGCRGFVTKDKGAGILADALKQAIEGKIYFLPEIAERLALLGVLGDDSPRAKLDARELQAFILMAGGATNAETAETMGIGLKTMGLIGQAIREKLGVQRQTDLTRLAVKHGLLEP